MPIALLIFSIFLETYSTFPFVLVLLVFLSIHLSKTQVLSFAFLGGILLDVFLFRQLGQSSIFFLIFSFLILSYQNKFEADTIAFVSLFSFIGAFFYMLFTNQENALLVSVTAALLSFAIYIIYKNKLGRKKKKW